MTDTESSPNLDEQQPVRSTRRRLTPPTWILVVVAALILLPIGVKIGDFLNDNAIANLLIALGILLTTIVLFGWFLFRSGYRLRTRLATLAVTIAAGTIAGYVYRLDDLSGELVPTFRYRWTPQADTLLDIPESGTSPTVVDINTITDDDFPQFLGPHRDSRARDIPLNRDWGTYPPKCLWRQPIGAGWSSFVAVNGYAVTQEQRDEFEMVICYELMSGEAVWSYGVKTRHVDYGIGDGPRGTPTIHEGKVYTQGATGVLLCLDGATGEVLWEDNILDRYGVKPGEDKGVRWGRSGSPLIVDDLLIVPAGGPAGGTCVSLAAFHKDTGELVWEAGDRQVSYASPVLSTLGGKRQVLSVNEDNVSAHDVATGKELWSYDWPGQSSGNASVSQPVPLGDDSILLSKGYGGGSLLLRVKSLADNGLQVDEVWRFRRLLRTKFTNVVVHDGYIYGLSDGVMECVDARDGSKQWKRGRYGHGQILGVEDLLLVLAESGEVVMVQATPSEHKELGRCKAIEGKTWNNLCLYGRYLLVRNSEEAACYELPLSEDVETE